MKLLVLFAMASSSFGGVTIERTFYTDSGCSTEGIADGDIYNECPQCATGSDTDWDCINLNGCSCVNGACSTFVKGEMNWWGCDHYNDNTNYDETCHATYSGGATYEQYTITCSGESDVEEAGKKIGIAIIIILIVAVVGTICGIIAC